MKIDPFLPNRVLMTVDTISGIWHYSLDLTRAFQEYDITVDLAVLGPPLFQHQKEEASAISNLRVHEGNYPLEWMHQAWKGVDESGEWLQHLAHELSPDLIHFNHFANAHLTFEQPKLIVAHSDALSWWRSVRGGEAPADWDEYRTRIKRGFRAVSTVIAPTRAYLESIVSDFGPFRRAKVIPNGRTDLQIINIPKEPSVLIAGRIWDPAKNIAALEAAAPHLSWPVSAAGNPKSLTGELIETPHIQLLGEISDEALSLEYAKASIYVMPAKYEPFGLSILEAAMNECALVISDLPSLRENWEEAAIFVDPNDIHSLKFEIESLIQNPEQRKTYGLRAKHRSRKFNLKNAADSYIKEYRRLMQTQLLVSSGQFFPNRGRSIRHSSRSSTS